MSKKKIMTKEDVTTKDLEWEEDCVVYTECSQCGSIHDSDDVEDYCTECGAEDIMISTLHEGKTCFLCKNFSFDMWDGAFRVGVFEDRACGFELVCQNCFNKLEEKENE